MANKGTGRKKGTQRKLTAILSADVAGYSRLMGDDEEATIETLTAHRKVFLSHIETHRGRVVDAKGARSRAGNPLQHRPPRKLQPCFGCGKVVGGAYPRPDLGTTGGHRQARSGR